MAFVPSLFNLVGNTEALRICGARRCEARPVRTRVCLEQLISKPMRPNSPSGGNSGGAITDYSKLTDIRPDPVKRKSDDDNDDVPDGDPDVIYYSECSRCHAIYELRPKVLGSEGRKVQCCVCKNQWFQHRDKLNELNKEKQVLEDYPKEKMESFQRDSHGGSNRRERGQVFTAFIGNLGFHTTRDTLAELFKNRNPLRVHIVEKEGKSRGYAFVDFGSRDELDSAVKEMNGIQLDGRELTVKEGRNSS
eukprot:Plantae.Rhodophyta-Purpureofilum_apyrenoidigerum.ctg12689.p1 GENE.Plantae.Rhodophyta-Purpureofilum_apyrenoidigerum.ctg12689~~Plantae.Rhodophyta-Purpureofilum_apyrenoidigerum.ctg12689.p1  ORF type:complete len:249 (-),score=38.72 Plantae.Rhodophyta-Purpureofilum_apyrenoidigerum.ctg12689:411-1157(-)